MRALWMAAGVVTLFAVTSASAQTSTANKPETNCTPSAVASASPGSSQTTGSTANAMAIEKNAILPSAGGHANSAAPTVQSNGEPMQVRPDCPPDQTKPKE